MSNKLKPVSEAVAQYFVDYILDDSNGPLAALIAAHCQGDAHEHVAVEFLQEVVKQLSPCKPAPTEYPAIEIIYYKGHPVRNSVGELEINTRLANCLHFAGITKITEALNTSDRELLKLDNMGKRSLAQLKVELDFCSGGCHKCGGIMSPSTYIVPHMGGVPDFPGDNHPVTMSVTPGPANSAPCLKCVECGWSVT